LRTSDSNDVLGHLEGASKLVDAYERVAAHYSRRANGGVDLPEIVSFYAWLAGKRPRRRRSSDRVAQVAAVLGLGWALVLLVLVLAG
jgi:hypothetical protein